KMVPGSPAGDLFPYGYQDPKTARPVPPLTHSPRPATHSPRPATHSLNHYRIPLTGNAFPDRQRIPRLATHFSGHSRISPATTAFLRPLKHSLIGKAEKALVSNDHMIEHGNVQDISGDHQPFGKFDVSIAWPGVPRRMIVTEDDRSSPLLERGLENDPRIGDRP